MVIDEKGGEEHGLKLSLAREKRRRRVEEKLSSECVCLSQTGLIGLGDWSAFLYSKTVIIHTLISFVDLRIVMSATLCFEPFLNYLSGFVLV